MCDHDVPPLTIGACIVCYQRGQRDEVQHRTWLQEAEELVESWLGGHVNCSAQRYRLCQVLVLAVLGDVSTTGTGGHRASRRATPAAGLSRKSGCTPQASTECGRAPCQAHRRRRRGAADS